MSTRTTRSPSLASISALRQRASANPSVVGTHCADGAQSPNIFSIDDINAAQALEGLRTGKIERFT